MPNSSNETRSAGRRNRYRDAVQRIAETLGVPVDLLKRSAASDEFPDETSELLRLWFKIKDTAARQAILDQLRKIVNE